MMSDSLVCPRSYERGAFTSRWRRGLPILLAFLALGFSGRAQTSSSSSSSTVPERPTQDYLVYVVCESADKIVLNDIHSGLWITKLGAPKFEGSASSPGVRKGERTTN